MPRILLLAASLACLSAVACSASSSGDTHADSGSASSSGSSSGGGDSDACAPYQSDADLTTPTVSFQADVIPLLERSCGIAGSTCHGTPSVGAPLDAGGQQRPFLGYFDGGTDAAQVAEGLVGIASNEDPQMNEVTASTPGQSYMMHKLDWDECTLAAACAKGATQYTDCGQGMPYSSPQLDPDMRDIIRRWIAQGAKTN